MGIMGVGLKAVGAGASGAGKVGAGASNASVGVATRLWRAVPPQQRPYALFAGVAGIASTAAFAVNADNDQVRTARFYGGMAPIAATVMGGALALSGGAKGKLRPATAMLKWTAPIAVPALAFGIGRGEFASLIGASEPAKPEPSKPSKSPKAKG